MYLAWGKTSMLFVFWSNDEYSDSKSMTKCQKLQVGKRNFKSDSCFRFKSLQLHIRMK